MSATTAETTMKIGNRLFMAVREVIDLPLDKRLLASKAVMDAIWSQQISTDKGDIPKINNIADLVNALQRGLIYNTREGDELYSWFGDIRPVGQNGQLLGHGIQAPDGAIVRNGQELVDWRNRRWAELQSPTVQ